MLFDSPQNLPQFSFFDIAEQLDPQHPLLALGRSTPWSDLEDAFASLYAIKAALPSRFG